MTKKRAFLVLALLWAPEAQPREYEDEAELLAAVRTGEVAISIQPALAARSYLRANPSARIHLRLCEIGAHPLKMAIAVPPGRHDLVNWLNAFLEEREIYFNTTQLLAHEGRWRF